MEECFIRSITAIARITISMHLRNSQFSGRTICPLELLKYTDPVTTAPKTFLLRATVPFSTYQGLFIATRRTRLTLDRRRTSSCCCSIPHWRRPRPRPRRPRWRRRAPRAPSATGRSSSACCSVCLPHNSFRCAVARGGRRFRSSVAHRGIHVKLL